MVPDDVVNNSSLQNESSADHKKDNSRNGLGRRHFIVLMCFCMNVVNYAQKVNLSVGIVAMTDNSHNSAFKQYNWDEFKRGIILSSLYWGYTVVPLPGGWIGQRIGAKIPLFVCIITGSALTILTPLITTIGWEYLCAARVLIGAAQGSADPSIQIIMAKWLHPDERGFLASMTFAGSKLGMCLMLGLGGPIAGSLAGWPTIFYFSGTIGLIWCAIWWIYVTDTPEQCTNLSTEERLYLSCIPDTTLYKRNIPWCGILTSIPFWSTFITHVTASWGFYLLLTEIPTYLNGVYHFDINSNGLLSAIPYFLMFVLTFVSSFLSKFLITRNYITHNTSRKMFNSIGMWGQSILLLIISYTWQYTTLSMIILILMVGVNCGVNVGFLINYLDLSPNYVGLLMGIGTFGGNITSILGPLFVGYIVTDNSDPSLWRIVFIVTSVLSIIGNSVFVFFGSVDIQKWNEPQTFSEDDESNVTVVK